MLQRNIIHTPLDGVNFEAAIVLKICLSKEDQAVSHQPSCIRRELTACQ